MNIYELENLFLYCQILNLDNLAEIIKYAEQYRANRSYHIGYKKAKNPDAYFRRYESQIILYGGAKRMLEQAGVNLKSLNINKLKSEYEELIKQKSELTVTYKNCEKEVKKEVKFHFSKCQVYSLFTKSINFRKI